MPFRTPPFRVMPRRPVVSSLGPADMTGRAADDGTQNRAAQRTAYGAIGLSMAGGLAGGDITGARRGVTAAMQIARTCV